MSKDTPVVARHGNRRVVVLAYTGGTAVVVDGDGKFDKVWVHELSMPIEEVRVMMGAYDIAMKLAKELLDR